MCMHGVPRSTRRGAFGMDASLLAWSARQQLAIERGRRQDDTVESVNEHTAEAAVSRLLLMRADAAGVPAVVSRSRRRYDALEARLDACGRSLGIADRRSPKRRRAPLEEKVEEERVQDVVLPPPLALRRPIAMGPLSLKLPLSQLPAEGSIEPDEAESKAAKLKRFSGVCSEICERLYLGSDIVARDLPKLQAHSISHVLNAAGTACANYHEDQLTYMTLQLYDSPSQELSPVLYSALDFIDTALGAGGSVFVHCQQGVSRSASIVIAYVMWKRQLSFIEAHAFVKERRGVAEPNAGFICALLELAKRLPSPPDLSPEPSDAPLPPRLYRLAPDFNAPAAQLVDTSKPRSSGPRRASFQGTSDGESLAAQLDPRTAFVLHVPPADSVYVYADTVYVRTETAAAGAVYVWFGGCARAEYVVAARSWARMLSKYELAPASVEEREGYESAAFCRALLGLGQVAGMPPTKASIEASSLQELRIQVECREQARYDADYGAGCVPVLTPSGPARSLPLESVIPPREQDAEEDATAATGADAKSQDGTTRPQSVQESMSTAMRDLLFDDDFSA